MAIQPLVEKTRTTTKLDRHTVGGDRFVYRVTGRLTFGSGAGLRIEYRATREKSIGGEEWVGSFAVADVENSLGIQKS